MTDAQKIDLLVQYAICAAAREEFPHDRLGPIHILKYIYLADVAHAEKHGATFTGADWRFYNFGPWCPAVHDRIRPAAVAAKFDVLDFEGEHSDFVRFRTRDRGLRDQLEPKLPIVVSRAIDKAIRKYGNDTPSLLEAVYLTKPMRMASPNERLIFEASEQPAKQSDPQPKTIGRKQQKIREERLRRMKEKVQAWEKRSAPPVAYTPPRYDDVFMQGVEWLNEQLPAPVTEASLELTFDDSIWKSDFRRDDDVP